MGRLTAILSLACLAGAARAATMTCAQKVATGGQAIAQGLTDTTYLDAAVTDGASYRYMVTANDADGYSCSNILWIVNIPSTGSHGVELTWKASTTPGVTYTVYRKTR